MPTRNGHYQLALIQIIAAGNGNRVAEARQQYGSLAAATRDADVFVRSGENRRAEVTHVAANGVESPPMYKNVSSL